MVMRRSGVRSAFHIVSAKNPRKSHGQAMNEDYKTNETVLHVSQFYYEPLPFRPAMRNRSIRPNSICRTAASKQVDAMCAASPSKIL